MPDDVRSEDTLSKRYDDEQAHILPSTCRLQFYWRRCGPRSLINLLFLSLGRSVVP